MTDDLTIAYHPLVHHLKETDSQGRCSFCALPEWGTLLEGGVPYRVHYRLVKDGLTGLILPGKFDQALTYYLAGPMSGYREYNYPAFATAASVLRNAGLGVLTPNENTVPVGLTDRELWRHMVRQGLDQLLSADGIILLEGWSGSTGAILEHTIAYNLKMPEYFMLDNNRLVQMSDGRHL